MKTHRFVLFVCLTVLATTICFLAGAMPAQIDDDCFTKNRGPRAVAVGAGEVIGDVSDPRWDPRMPTLLKEIAGEPAFKPKMSFAAAVKTYSTNAYNKDGHVDKDGKVVGGGLGCSAFVSVVLYQMREGKDFASRDWDWRSYQKLGKEIAQDFNLLEAGEFAATDLEDEELTKALLATSKATAGRVYLFDAHPGDGHTGFVRFSDSGGIDQWHYSGMLAYKGLATGDFRKWVKGSQYKNGTFTLFEVPQ